MNQLDSNTYEGICVVEKESVFSKSDDIVKLLHDKGIPFELCRHLPAYTIEDLTDLAIPHKEWIVKNLFLRDDKKKNYYLVTLPGHKIIDLKELRKKISSRRLSFANEDTLYEMMLVQKGHVTPFGILNNKKKNIIVIFDAFLQGKIVGVHPMENDKTVFLHFEDLVALIKHHENPVYVYDI